METFDKIFVLNLDCRQDRMERLNDILHYLEIPYERFPALHKDTVVGLHASLIKQQPYSTINNAGYLACLLSHLSIYKLAIDRGYKSILIFEDDILIHKNAKEMVYDVLKKVPDNWDVLYFGYLKLSEDLSTWSHYMDSDSFINDSIVRSRGFWCCHSYAINVSLMKEILQLYSENSTSMPIEIDRFLVKLQAENYDSERKWNFYGCTRRIFGQIGCNSDLSPNFNTEENVHKFIHFESTPLHDFL
jgi:glycosyl transferase family 25